jgi:hypothetical protein
VQWHSQDARGNRRRSRAYRHPVDFDRHRALEQFDRDYQPTASLELKQDTFEASKRPAFYANSCAQPKVLTRLHRQTRVKNSLHCCYLVIGYRHRGSAGAHDVNHARNLEHWQAIPSIEPAKNVTREEGAFDYPEMSVPGPPLTEKR